MKKEEKNCFDLHLMENAIVQNWKKNSSGEFSSQVS